MTLFLQYLIPGLLIGLVYALVALGIVIIYKCSHVINFAQGDIVVIGAYTAWGVMTGLQMHSWLTVVLTIGLAVLLGFIVARLIVNPLLGQPLLSTMLPIVM